MVSDWNRLDRHVVSAESIISFNESWMRVWIGMTGGMAKYIVDYSKGGRYGTVSCRTSTDLLQTPHFLCSYEDNHYSCFYPIN